MDKKPFFSEICTDCKLWNKYTGCEFGRTQESASMTIFGYCGIKPKNNENSKTD